VLDVHRGRMSWRRLRVLIQHLPPESATMTALRNAMPPDELEQLAKRGEPERGRWSQLEQLVALSIDVQREHMHAFLLANHGKGRKPEKPEPVRRPGARQRKKKLEPMTEGAAERLFALING
jgi:hypothetical protein